MSEMFRLASKAKWNLFYHPCIKADFERDKDTERVKLRTELLSKYHELSNAPYLSVDSPEELKAEKNSNDWVDGNLLLAVVKNAVDILVTDDLEIHKKAVKLNVGNRVKTSVEILQELKDFYEVIPPPPPAVVSCKAHVLNDKDPIFDSLRADYAPKFDDWLIKIKRDQRDCFVIYGEGEALAAFCIIKPEDQNEYGLQGKTLKLSTFKVSDKYSRQRFGELLLKPVFDFLFENNYDHAYVTVLPKYPELMEYLRGFGFEDSGHKTTLGEVVLVKRFKFSQQEQDAMLPLEFNRLFGPWLTKFDGNKSYLIPIQPQFHEMLFPELRVQSAWLPEKPCGNSIRKAYLSNSKIKKMRPGDNVFFYRSGDTKAITALGIIEDIKFATDADEIMEYVGDRTVYSFVDIQKLCEQQVLAIKFRRVMFFESPIAYTELKANGVLSGAPQSILEIKGEGLTWITSRI